MASQKIVGCMRDNAIPAIVQFPLEGEWTALRTPAARVPSHGTDFLGQRYAYDFVRRTGRRLAPFGPSVLAHAYGMVKAERFAGWGASVRAATAGRVVTAIDGWPDRHRINAIAELARMRVVDKVRPPRVRTSNWRTLTGNYLLIESDIGVALYAHLQKGSLCVRVGDEVVAGQALAQVGNSGRSSMPHLHFHLMDRADGIHAIGLPCAFESYERWDGKAWHPASGVPGLGERIRAA